MTHPCKALDLLRLLARAGSQVLLIAPLAAQSTPVPAVNQVPPGNEEYLRASASGMQNDMCMPSCWIFIGPQPTFIAKIANMRQQVAAHFLSPNPEEAITARATWQSSVDTSTVWAKGIAMSSDYAGAETITWPLLQVIGAENSPGGGSGFSETTYIQPVNTTRGTAPASPCLAEMRSFVPYTAEYVFCQKAEK